MHASKNNWVRYPQHTPTKGNVLYKVITADGAVENIPYSDMTKWDSKHILAFVDEPVRKPKDFSYPVRVQSEEQRSLYREYMDAGKYTQFTDVESPAQLPIKNQLQTIMSSLPEEDLMQQLEAQLVTLKKTFLAYDLESVSADVQVDKLMTDILEIRKRLKSVVAGMDSLNRDLSLTNAYAHKNSSEPPYEKGRPTI